MFGCDSEQQKFYSKRSRLFDHLIEAHTNEELEGWGINRQLLIKEARKLAESTDKL